LLKIALPPGDKRWLRKTLNNQDRLGEKVTASNAGVDKNQLRTEQSLFVSGQDPLRSRWY